MVKFKIYEIFEPKIRLLIVISNLQSVSTLATNISGKIQALLDQLKFQKNDITAAQTALNDLNAQLKSINTLLATDKTLITNITIQTMSEI